MTNEVLGDRTNAEEGNERLKQYKNLSKHEDMRRRRTECSVEIRKQKRDELLMKRRNFAEEEDDVDDAETSTENSAAAPPEKVAARLPFPEVIRILMSSPSMEQTRDCFESIRRALSKSKNPPVEEVIQCGLLEALVQALAVEDEKVRFEAAWALTNVVSGTSEQTMKAVEAGATQPLVALTMHSSDAIAEQALWAVANIAGDTAQLRDYVIECGGVPALMTLVGRLGELSTSHARTLAWAFSNMCRHKNPPPPLPVLSELSKGLTKLITHEDRTVRQDTCWAISYMTDGPDEQIALARNETILGAVVGMLEADTEMLIAPALRVLGNMATGNDEMTQAVIDVGTLKLIKPVINRSKSNSIIKECCWLVSNVIAGTQAQIQAVIEASVLPTIVGVLEQGDFKCQFEAGWVLANLCQGGTRQQILYLLHSTDVIQSICAVLPSTNADFNYNILEVLYTLLTSVSVLGEEEMNKLKEDIEEKGGLDAIEELQNNDNEKVYQIAYKIVSEFFADDEEIDENVPEESGPVAGGGFRF